MRQAAMTEGQHGGSSGAAHRRKRSPRQSIHNVLRARVRVRTPSSRESRVPCPPPPPPHTHTHLRVAVVPRRWHQKPAPARGAVGVSRVSRWRESGTYQSSAHIGGGEARPTRPVNLHAPPRRPPPHPRTRTHARTRPMHPHAPARPFVQPDLVARVVLKRREPHHLVRRCHCAAGAGSRLRPAPPRPAPPREMAQRTRDKREEARLNQLSNDVGAKPAARPHVSPAHEPHTTASRRAAVADGCVGAPHSPRSAAVRRRAHTADAARAPRQQ